MKRRMRVKFRLPEYTAPRTRWRIKIHSEAAAAIRKAGVRFRKEDSIELVICIYLSAPQIFMHDVDNRLKDIMDALQGRAGSYESKHRKLPPLIHNDSQIYKVTIEKQLPPGQSHGLGHVTIRKYER